MRYVRDKEVGSVQIVPIFEVRYWLEQGCGQRKTPGKDRKNKRRRNANEGGLIWRGKLNVGNNAHIAARSLTPKERLTSWTIILSLPPSAVSSGTSIAAACTSASSGSIAGGASWVD